MVKYCMNQETGAVNRQNRQEVLPDKLRKNQVSQKLRQPKSGFKEDRKQEEVPVKQLSNRERLLNRNIS